MLTCNHFNIDLGGEGRRGRAQHELELKERAIDFVWDCSKSRIGTRVVI